MEMERINENTIRVLIESEDLVDRGITFLDLLGNHKQIENFFYSILEEVDVDEQFQESDAITFQVVPNRDGLELFISKNLNLAEDMDFNEMAENNDMRAFSDMLRRQAFNSTNEGDQDQSIEDSRDIVLVFQNFEEVVLLAKEVYLQGVSSNLYRYNDKFYLHIAFPIDEQLLTKQLENDLALLLEFGNIGHVRPDVLIEHGELVMGETALELIRYYFK